MHFAASAAGAAAAAAAAAAVNSDVAAAAPAAVVLQRQHAKHAQDCCTSDDTKVCPGAGAAAYKCPVASPTDMGAAFMFLDPIRKTCKYAVLQT
jgi:hypothetical protein